MGDYVCLFKVLVWDELEEVNKIEQGFCFANSFAQAAEWLEKTLYGDSLLEIQHLELFDTCPVIELEVWNALKKDLEGNE